MRKRNLGSKSGGKSLLKTSLTPSGAIAAFERAFRSGNPNEVERLLRDMLNVQVAVVDDKQKAEERLAKGEKIKTIPVPYGVFLRKIREILAESNRGKDAGIYLLKPTDNRIPYLLSPIFSLEEILPGKTYVLLSNLAGYSNREGLTFSGSGCSTGFEEQPETEWREKFTEGRFQIWEEHSQGVWERSERIAKIYRPFIQTWTEHVLNEQWKGSPDQKEQFVESVLWAIRVAALLHDVGKLNQRWQDVVWGNEKRIRNESVEQQKVSQLIARTSPLPNDEIRKQLVRPPSHASFAYPFLKAFLRELLGDYRFLDTIALAAARHHCLEVAGAVRKGDFKLSEGADDVLRELLERVLGELSENEKNVLKNALDQALCAVQEETKADEPPSPSDDFYFIYCLANRMVKVCDWEDASQTTIELQGLEG